MTARLEKRPLFAALFWIPTGAAVFALGVDALVLPNRLAQGGVTGIADLAHYLWGVPVVYLYIGLNLPLLVVAVRALGWRFSLRTIAAIALVSLFLPLLAHVRLPLHDRLLAALYAGVAIGIGVGFIQRGESSVGGTDILAQILYRRRRTSMTQVYLVSDVCILGVAALRFGLEIAMLTWVVTFVSGRVATFVMEGTQRGFSCHIVTNAPDVLIAHITEELGRGVTVIPARGGYTALERDFLWVVCAPHQLVPLRNLVFTVDPGAFFAAAEAAEVFGRGFRSVGA